MQIDDFPIRSAAAIVALGGIAVSAYLTWAHYADASVICVTGGGCETVQSSSYAELAGTPVALLGLLSYSMILALIAWDAAIARLAAATLAFVGLLFGVFLLGVQLFVIDALCTGCVVNDVLLAPALALLTALRLRLT